ncbi:MAG: FAD:protein FMN transferase [Acidobacteria bacterium]|nr:FAD:protein FMN transferase [Acidobacteriota bacterium]
MSMACLYTIEAYGPDAATLRPILNEAFDEVDRIDRLMSNYKRDSELSRINADAARHPLTIDPELFDFIADALRYTRESDGAFDITVGPLMRAWGFFGGEGRVPPLNWILEALPKATPSIGSSACCRHARSRRRWSAPAAARSTGSRHRRTGTAGTSTSRIRFTPGRSRRQSV